MVIKIRYWILLLVSTVAFLLCHIYSTNGKGIRDAISLEVLLFICIACFTLLYHKRNRFYLVKRYRLGLFILFPFLLVSAVSNEPSLFSVVCFSFVSLLLLSDLSIYHNVYSIISLSLILEVITYYLFYGVGEENGIAINLSCGLVAVLCLLINQLRLNRNQYLILVLIWMSLGIGLLYITLCRGGILSIFLTGIYALFSQFETNKYGKKVIIGRVFVLLIAVLSVYFMLSVPEFEQLFFEKWEGGDITSNRLDIWKSVVSSATPFGLGADYYMRDFDAHNSFIDFLGTFGWIPSILVVLLLGTLYFNCHKKSPIPLPTKVFIVYWTVLSLTENLNPLTTRFLLVSLYLYVNIAHYFSTNTVLGSSTYGIERI